MLDKVSNLSLNLSNLIKECTVYKVELYPYTTIVNTYKHG